MSFFQLFSTSTRNENNHTALATIDSLSMEEHDDDVQDPDTTVMMSNSENESSSALPNETRSSSSSPLDISPPSNSSLTERHVPTRNSRSTTSPQSEMSSVLQDERIINYVTEHQNRSRIHNPVLLVVCMFLFRLFLEGLENGDVRILVAILLALWFLRWIQLHRMEEERFDDELAGVIDEVLEGGGGGGDRTLLASGADLQRLGFRGQLALAMMESRRYMMETGGFGRPDGEEVVVTGVSEETKAGWKTLNFETASGNKEKEGYDDMLVLKRTDSGCCICLGEFENGECLCELPCGHIFHETCISNWCENHQRCPLCNINLEEVHKEQHKTVGVVSCIQPSNDSMV